MEDIEGFRSGDRDVFRALVTRHGPYVLRVARSFATDDASADDLFQDIWTKVWEHRHQYSGDGAFLSWLATLARNECISRYRTERSERTRLKMAKTQNEPVGLGAPPDGPAAEVERKEAYAELRRALSKLPSRQRHAIDLRLLQDYDSKRASEVMDCKPATVRSLMRNGLQRLRHLMAEQEADA